jgi:BolA-like protein 3
MLSSITRNTLRIRALRTVVARNIATIQSCCAVQSRIPCARLDNVANGSATTKVNAGVHRTFSSTCIQQNMIKLAFIQNNRTLTTATMQHMNNNITNQRQCRTLSTSNSEAKANSDSETSSESAIRDLLAKELQPVHLSVEDTSGGCGSFFAIHVVSEKFNGLMMVKQHRLVNDILKDHIKDIHGMTLNTQTPEKFAKSNPSV